MIQSIVTAAGDPWGHWAAIATILAEGLIIAGAATGGVTTVIRWQRKKDQLEEKETRNQIKDEVAAQIEGFKQYFESRLQSITTGVNRTVSAVERNTGSSIPDALARVENRQREIDSAIKEILKKLAL